jgi:parallel beta-helix repeat protein
MSKANFAGLVLLALVSVPALATTGVMQVSGNRTLTENHKGTIVLASGANLNCNGKLIESGTQGNVCGTNNERSCGVLMKSGPATVRNCKIEGFNTGIDVLDVSSPTIDSNTVTENVVGVRLRNIFGSGSVTNNTVMENTEEGFNIDGSSGITFRNNHVSYNDRDGFDVGTSQTLTFRGNNVSDNGLNGIELDDSMYIAIIKNTISHNGRNNNRSGVSFDNSDFSRAACNSSDYNGRNGFRITTDSDNNIIEKNTAKRNIEADAFEDGTSNNNTWTGNVFKDRGQTGTPDCSNVN